MHQRLRREELPPPFFEPDDEERDPELFEDDPDELLEPPPDFPERDEPFFDDDPPPELLLAEEDARPLFDPDAPAFFPPELRLVREPEDDDELLDAFRPPPREFLPPRAAASVSPAAPRSPDARLTAIARSDAPTSTPAAPPMTFSLLLRA